MVFLLFIGILLGVFLFGMEVNEEDEFDEIDFNFLLILLDFSDVGWRWLLVFNRIFFNDWVCKNIFFFYCLYIRFVIFRLFKEVFK